MNKFLMMSTAALLGCAGPALCDNASKAHTITFYTGSGNVAYCDGMQFQKAKGQGKHIVTGTHLNEDCAGDDGQVAGAVDKAQYTLNETESSYSLVYEIYKPVKNGGNWDVYACYDGSSCVELNAGIYQLGFSGNPGSRVSTTAKVAEMIGARRAAKRSR